MTFLLVFAVAFCLSLVTTPLAARLGRQWKMVDVPGGRREHTGVVPRTGGMALHVAFSLAALDDHLTPEPSKPGDPPPGYIVPGLGDAGDRQFGTG